MKIDDVRIILSALNDANVRYLIVGGLAVVAHGYVRFTQDIDLVIQLERENVLRAMNALTAIGYRPLILVDAAQFAAPDEINASLKPPATANVPYQWVIRRLALGVFLDSDKVFVPEGGSLKLVELAPNIQHVVGCDDPDHYAV